MRNLRCAVVIGLLLAARACDDTPNATKPKSTKTEQKPNAEMTEPDIAKEFGAIVDLAKKNRFDPDAANVSYDVEKTNSLISPFTALLSWDIAKGLIHVRAHYAYQDGRWVFKGAEAKTQDGPWKETALYDAGSRRICEQYYTSLPSR